ncbi:MarR family winged helix-turn-helix transcriptional regulator [Demequina phytophila]|uniref:MarR family winged helix-turn-helix transcriptional regulator n=1 Tax=Demequina phytophila TaxID=1638981 RepID=UPI000783D483|nr:MarR family transcriptional regulator [Demequina phytophila]
MTREATIAEILELQGRLMRVSMRDHSRTMVDEGLTPVQFHLLVFLRDRASVPTAEAAEAMGLRPNIATGVVQRLVERGWIARDISPEDGRVRLLSLTPDGITLVDAAIEEAERGFIGHLSALSDAQVEQLHGILATILADGADERNA